MGQGVESARDGLGLTERDMADMRAARRRNRLAIILAGGLGVFAGAVTGLVLSSMVNSNNDNDYPYVFPAAAGLACAASVKPKVNVFVAAVVGFMVTVIVFASMTSTVTMYGVWHRD